MENKCCIKNCKSKYGGWIDVSLKDKKGKYTGWNRLPFCKKHWNKVYPEIKRREKKLCEPNTFWFVAPVEEVERALNL